MKIWTLLFVVAFVRGQGSDSSDQDLRGLRPLPRPSPPSGYRPATPNNYGKPGQNYAKKPTPQYVNRPVPSYGNKPDDSDSPAYSKPLSQTIYNKRPYNGEVPYSTPASYDVPSSYSPAYPQRPAKQYSFSSQYPPSISPQQPYKPSYNKLPSPQPQYSYSSYEQQLYPGGNTLLIELINELIDKLNQNTTTVAPPNTTTTSTATPSTTTTSTTTQTPGSSGFASFASLFPTSPMMSQMFTASDPSAFAMMVQSNASYPPVAPNTTAVMMTMDGINSMMSPPGMRPAVPANMMMVPSNLLFMRDSPTNPMVMLDDPRSPITTNYAHPAPTYSQTNSQNSYEELSGLPSYSQRPAKSQRPAYNSHPSSSSYNRPQPAYQRPTPPYYIDAHQQSTSSPTAASYGQNAVQPSEGSQHYQQAHGYVPNAPYPAEEPVYNHHSGYNY